MSVSVFAYKHILLQGTNLVFRVSILLISNGNFPFKIMTKCLENVPCHLLNEPKGRQAKARKSLLSERYRQLNHCHDNFPLVHNVPATGACVSVMNLMGFAEDTAKAA